MFRPSAVLLRGKHAAAGRPAILPDRAEILRLLGSTRLTKDTTEQKRAQRGSAWRDRRRESLLSQARDATGPEVVKAYSDVQLTEQLKVLCKGTRKVGKTSEAREMLETMVREASCRLSPAGRPDESESETLTATPRRGPLRELLVYSMKGSIAMDRMDLAEELLFPPVALRSVFPYQLLITAYARSGRADSAFAVYHRMRDIDVMLPAGSEGEEERKAKVAVFGSLIAACGKDDACHSSVLMWLAEMRNFGLSPTRQTLHSLLPSWLHLDEQKEKEKTSHPGSAIDTFMALMDEHDVAPNSATFCLLLRHCCTREEHIVRVLRHMQEHGRAVSHTSSSRVALLNAYVRVGSPEKALKALASYFVGGADREKILRLSQDFLPKDMEGENSGRGRGRSKAGGASASSFTLAAKSQMESFRLATSMVDEFADPKAMSTQLFNSAIVRGKETGAAVETQVAVWQAMRRNMMAPSANAMCALLRSIAQDAWKQRLGAASEDVLAQARVLAAVQARSRELLEQVWKDCMHLYGRPPLRLCHELLRAYAASCNLELAVEALEVMPLLAHMPTTTSYRILLEAFLAEDHKEAALLVVRLMAEGDVSVGEDIVAKVEQTVATCVREHKWALPESPEEFLGSVMEQLASPDTYVRKKQQKVRGAIFLRLHQLLEE